MQKSIVIKNGDKKAELIISESEDSTQYAIKKSNTETQVINREVFHNIIENARNSGYEVTI